MAKEFHKDIDPVNPIKEETASSGKQALLEQARQRASDGWLYWNENYRRASASVAFNDGNQWSQQAQDERTKSGRPTFTFNRMPQYINRVAGDIRQSRIQINVTPSASYDDDKYTALSGGKEFSSAELMSGVIRNIESLSNAQDAYVGAGVSAANAGFGWLRVLPEYLHDEAFEEDLLIRQIRDIQSVVIDPATMEEDGEDMGWAFVRHAMSLAEFRTRWPNARTGELGDYAEYNTGFWQTRTKETIHVCEYYHREPTTRVLAQWADGSTGWLDESEGRGEPVRTRDVKRWRVMVDLITAYDVLEKQAEWADDTIPIVPVWGQTSRNGNEFKTFSLTHHAKGAQQSFNYERTAQIEVGALAPKKPAVGTDTQFEGHPEWDRRNVDNPSKLTFTPDPMHPQPPYLLEAGMPPVHHMQAAQAAAADIEATIGIYAANLGADSKEKSGRAIIAKQDEGRLGSNVYMHNLATAVRRVGKIITRAFPSYYSGARVLRIMHDDGSTDDVAVNQPGGIDPESGEPIIINDLNIGRYDVAVTIGKAYGTQRMEDAEKLMGVIQAMPAVGEVASDLVVGAMDFAAARPLAKRLEKTIPQELKDGGGSEELTPEQQQQMAQQQQQQMMVAEVEHTKAQAEMLSAQADMAKAQADMAQAEADKIKARADIAMAMQEEQ